MAGGGKLKFLLPSVPACLLLLGLLLPAYGFGFDPRNYKSNCRDGTIMTSLRSSYETGEGDRRWRLGCSDHAGRSGTGCRWTGGEECSYVQDRAIMGVDSEYFESYNLRKNKILCCSFPGYKTENCRELEDLDPAINAINMTVSADEVITAAFDLLKMMPRFRVCNFVKE